MPALYVFFSIGEGILKTLGFVRSRLAVFPRNEVSPTDQVVSFFLFVTTITGHWNVFFSCRRRRQ